MGSVFDRDIMYGGLRLDQEFQIGEGQANAAHFILWNARVIGEIETDIGQATKTVLIVSRLDSPTEAFVVGTLSGPIAQKFAAVDDLSSDPNIPAVCAVFTTPASKEGYNDATVIQFVEKYEGESPANLPKLPEPIGSGTPLD